MELETGNTPKALQDQPKVYGLVKEVVDAFQILHRHRSAGMAPNPIQLSEVVAYINLYGPPSTDIDLFLSLITVVDNVYLERYSGNKSPS